MIVIPVVIVLISIVDGVLFEEITFEDVTQKKMLKHKSRKLTQLKQNKDLSLYDVQDRFVDENCEELRDELGKTRNFYKENSNMIIMTATEIKEKRDEFVLTEAAREHLNSILSMN